MPEDVTIFTSRRAYFYRADAIRLTVLTRSSNVIHDALNFQLSQLGTPPSIFGPVPTTSPPGLVFADGGFTATDGTITPIRFLHIEPRRVVIAVAGPSALIDPVFDQLRAIAGALRSPDGRPALGDPASFRDSSELVARLAFPADQLVPEALRPIMRDVLGVDEGNGERVLIPLLQARSLRPDAEYEGAIYQYPVLQLEPRGGTTPNEHVYFSLAPLRSEEHIALLSRIERALTPMRS